MSSCRTKWGHIIQMSRFSCCCPLWQCHGPSSTWTSGNPAPVHVNPGAVLPRSLHLCLLAVPSPSLPIRPSLSDAYSIPSHLYKCLKNCHTECEPLTFGIKCPVAGWHQLAAIFSWDIPGQCFFVELHRKSQTKPEYLCLQRHCF